MAAQPRTVRRRPAVAGVSDVVTHTPPGAAVAGARASIEIDLYIGQLDRTAAPIANPVAGFWFDAAR